MPKRGRYGDREIPRVRKPRWNVVLVDDDDGYALIIEQALRTVACVPVEVRRARSGGEALALPRESLPDLLLLDLKIPGMGSHEALKEIKGDDTLRSVPVAILSSSDRDDDVATSYGLGGNHFITKPSNPRELEVKLGALLRNLTELGHVFVGGRRAHRPRRSALWTPIRWRHKRPFAGWRWWRC